MRLWCVSVVFIFTSTTSLAQREGASPAPTVPSAQTNPIPARVQKADPIARLRLSQDVPADTENYRFVISTKHAPEQAGATTVAAYLFNDDGMVYEVGTVTMGLEIALNAFKKAASILYYRVPFSSIQAAAGGQTNPPPWAWVSGRHIEALKK